MTLHDNSKRTGAVEVGRGEKEKESQPKTNILVLTLAGTGGRVDAASLSVFENNSRKKGADHDETFSTLEFISFTHTLIIL